MYALRKQKDTDIQVRPKLRAPNSVTGPTGYTASSRILSDSNKKDFAPTSKIVDKIMTNPVLLKQLTDRVYELMQEETRLNLERRMNYGARF